MSNYVLRRVLIAIPVLFGITTLLFIAINIVPGDPVSMMVAPEMQHLADPEWMEQERERLGLNKPLPVRYIVWLGEVARGNLGYSILTGQPVSSMILQKLGQTIELTLTALVLSVVVGIPIGIISALKQYSLLDYGLTFLSFVLISVPGFFLGLLFIYVFAIKLDLLPTSGRVTLGQPFALADHVRYLVMPTVILGIEGTASMIRFARSSMLEVISQDYVRTAYAKGLRQSTVIIRHAFRNALLPVITILGLRIPRLFSGAVIIEQVFFWPGIGTTMINSAMASDYPVLMAIGGSTAFLVLFATLLTDIVYAYADPRICFE